MSSQSRIELYKEAMAIEHERAALQSKIDRLQMRLENINASLFSTSGTTSAPTSMKVRTSGAVSRPASSGKKPRAARGELKQRIFEALAAAGEAGIRVRDLAKSIGATPSALHSWFQFARKSIKAIRKAGTGRYRLVGSVPPQAPKANASAKPAKGARKSAGKQRGHLSAAVQDALKAAGKDGVSVGDLARTLAVNPRNLFVWFATTGKKNKTIRKVSPGHYCIKS